jgi:hypothetical protein
MSKNIIREAKHYVVRGLGLGLTHWGLGLGSGLGTGAKPWDWDLGYRAVGYLVRGWDLGVVLTCPYIRFII